MAEESAAPAPAGTDAVRSPTGDREPQGASQDVPGGAGEQRRELRSEGEEEGGTDVSWLLWRLLLLSALLAVRTNSANHNADHKNDNNTSKQRIAFKSIPEQSIDLLGTDSVSVQLRRFAIDPLQQYEKSALSRGPNKVSDPESTNGKQSDMYLA